MNATFSTNEIPVRHSVRPDVGCEFLVIDIFNGWDDVQKISKKILIFNGQKFKFCGWNSDSLKCYFFKPIDGEIESAEIK